MDIREVQRMKNELETAIHGVIVAFEDATGTMVDDVRVEHSEAHDCSGRIAARILHEVVLTVML